MYNGSCNKCRSEPRVTELLVAVVFNFIWSEICFLLSSVNITTNSQFTLQIKKILLRIPQLFFSFSPLSATHSMSTQWHGYKHSYSSQWYKYSLTYSVHQKRDRKSNARTPIKTGTKHEATAYIIWVSEGISKSFPLKGGPTKKLLTRTILPVSLITFTYTTGWVSIHAKIMLPVFYVINLQKPLLCSPIKKYIPHIIFSWES